VSVTQNIIPDVELPQSAANRLKELCGKDGRDPGKMIKMIKTKFHEIDVEKAEAREKQDMEVIKADISQGCGFKEVNDVVKKRLLKPLGKAIQPMVEAFIAAEMSETEDDDAAP